MPYSLVCGRRATSETIRKWFARAKTGRKFQKMTLSVLQESATLCSVRGLLMQLLSVGHHTKGVRSQSQGRTVEWQKSYPKNSGVQLQLSAQKTTLALSVFISVLSILCEMVNLGSGSVKQSFNRGDNGLGPFGARASENVLKMRVELTVASH